MDVLSILALNAINGGVSPVPPETVDATVIPFDPVDKTGTMTNPVGIDENGKLWTSGSGSGGATAWDELEDKPFQSVGDGLRVEGEALKLDDAPSDNKQYARKNGAWAEVTGGSGGGIPLDPDSTVTFAIGYDAGGLYIVTEDEE